MNTKLFGPSAWIFLFSSIMGRYPAEIDPNNPEHTIVKNVFRNMFKNMDTILPCIFCRKSWTGFYNSLPIEPFLKGRVQLMFWLYKMKDMVNKKLLKQEKECFSNSKAELREKYKNGTISESQYRESLVEISSVFKTTPSPPFKDILDFYEDRRGKCNSIKKTC